MRVPVSYSFDRNVLHNTSLAGGWLCFYLSSHHAPRQVPFPTDEYLKHKPPVPKPSVSSSYGFVLPLSLINSIVHFHCVFFMMSCSLTATSHYHCVEYSLHALHPRHGLLFRIGWCIGHHMGSSSPCVGSTTLCLMPPSWPVGWLSQYS